MLYLLDANVLIDANRDYYQMSRVPEFWDWLVEMGTHGLVKIPLEVYEEIKEGTDELAVWAKQEKVRSALLFDEECDRSVVATSVDEGYADDLTDDEVEKIGRDPFLIAYTRIDLSERCIVTTEISKPRQLRANRHLPDVCDQFGIHHCHTYEFIRKLDFKTTWKMTSQSPEKTVE